MTPLFLFQHRLSASAPHPTAATPPDPFHAPRWTGRIWRDRHGAGGRHVTPLGSPRGGGARRKLSWPSVLSQFVRCSANSGWISCGNNTRGQRASGDGRKASQLIPKPTFTTKLNAKTSFNGRGLRGAASVACTQTSEDAASCANPSTLRWLINNNSLSSR